MAETPENPTARAGDGAGEVPAPAKDKPSGASKDGYFEFKADANRVSLLIKAGITLEGGPPTREDIEKRLKALGVAHGVDWALVDRIIKDGLYDRTHLIAAATPSAESKNAWIEEVVKVDSEIKPHVTKEGKTDYKNVDNIHQVKQGDVVAVKHPMVEGKPGTDVFGKPLPTKPPQDASFKSGANTSVSPDGLKLIAEKGGFLFHQAGAICVGEAYVVRGDVNFKTGNLRYHGDIQVMGSVIDGFTVEADGNIIVDGNVEAGEVISTGGNVLIKQGVFGHGKGRIAAKGLIHVQSAQDIRLECQTLEVDKGLRNCVVKAESIKADKPGCIIMGGDTKVYSDVRVAVLGAEGCRTEVHIVDKLAEAARLRLPEIEKQRVQIAQKLEPVEKKLKGIKAMAERFGARMTERAMAEMKAVLSLYTELKKAQASLEEEKAKLAETLSASNRHTGKFVATEKVVWGGFLDIYGHVRELESEDVKKTWTWAVDGLACAPFTP